MSETQSSTHRVVLNGLQEGVQSADVVVKLSELFRTTAAQVHKLLATQGYVVKKGLTIDAANKYKSAIDATGAVCRIEAEMAPAQALEVDLPEPSYSPSSSGVDKSTANEVANSAAIPDGVKGWSWGAFLLSWIWAIGNKTWIGLLALVPYLGFVMALVLGFKGREWAWKNREWESVEQFNRVQKKWSFWGVTIIGSAFCIGLLAAIVIPQYQSYQRRAQQVEPERVAEVERASRAADEAAVAIPEFQPGEGYQAVRQKMLNAGWTPFHSPSADTCHEGDTRCKDRPEMEACAGSGMANCKFLWKRGDKTVAIMTVGEDASFDGLDDLSEAPMGKFANENSNVSVSAEEVKALKLTADDGHITNWASQGYGVNESTRVFCTLDRFGKFANCSLDILGTAIWNGHQGAPIWSLTRLKECSSKDPDMLMLKAFNGPRSPVRLYFDNDSEYIETGGNNEGDQIFRYVEGKLESKLQQAKSVKVLHAVRGDHEVAYVYNMAGYRKAVALITEACK